jgi:hypothetical protein
MSGRISRAGKKEERYWSSQNNFKLSSRQAAFVTIFKLPEA